MGEREDEDEVEEELEVAGLTLCLFLGGIVDERCDPGDLAVEGGAGRRIGDVEQRNKR